MSFETILPFLKPIAPLLLDSEISEVMINGNGSVFAQRCGHLEQVPVELESRHVEQAAKRIARLLGEDISETRPILDGRLPDGSRIAVVFPPCSMSGVTMTIRKFRPHWFTLAELAIAGALTPVLVEILIGAVRNRQTILVSGGTDTGKTTFTKALIDYIPATERLAVIEDTVELQIDHPNVVRFEARKEQRDASGQIVTPVVTIRDLVKATLRHRPDRLVIGEVRGGEAFDLLDALNTGHAGSISTVHANSALQALSRLATLTLRADIEMPYRAIQGEIGDLINLVIHVERKDGVRQVTQVLRLHGFNADTGRYETTSLYN